MATSKPEIKYWYYDILSNVTGMNSIPQCNDSTGILPNTNVRMYINMLHITLCCCIFTIQDLIKLFHAYNDSIINLLGMLMSVHYVYNCVRMHVFNTYNHGAYGNDQSSNIFQPSLKDSVMDKAI